MSPAIAVLMLVTHTPVFAPDEVAVLDRHTGRVSTAAAAGGHRRFLYGPRWVQVAARRVCGLGSGHDESPGARRNPRDAGDARR